jgi:protein-S-isoprenylcysteine O-methyltransferase Ste14
MKSRILVGLQFFIIFLMALPFTSKTTYPELGLIILVIGVVIGVFAINEHEKGNFNIRPIIKEDCMLVTTGIYSHIRHPMYLSVLLSMLGIAIIYFTYYEVTLYLLLVITLLVKLFYEESLWKCHGPEYEQYMKTTKRLIPFVF